LNGVLVGAALSIALLIHRASRPRVLELGRVPGTSFFADLVRHPENERVPGVLIIRTEGSLLYFNVDHVRDRLSALLAEREVPPRLVILFMGNVPFVDLAGVEMLADFGDTAHQRGIAFRLAEVRGPVREALRRLDRPSAIALAEANQTVDDVLVRWRATTQPAA
jgi:SulP family sulfate permease